MAVVFKIAEKSGLRVRVFTQVVSHLKLSHKCDNTDALHN